MKWEFATGEKKVRIGTDAEALTCLWREEKQIGQQKETVYKSRANVTSFQVIIPGNVSGPVAKQRPPAHDSMDIIVTIWQTLNNPLGRREPPEHGATSVRSPCACPRWSARAWQPFGRRELALETTSAVLQQAGEAAALGHTVDVRSGAAHCGRASGASLDDPSRWRPSCQC